MATATEYVGAPSVPNRNTAYMAQQAAEKALKAVILLDALPFELTHDLNAIDAQIPADFTVPVATSDLAWLTDLETSARHPDEADIVTLDDAQQAVALAGSILAAAEARFADRGLDPTTIVAS